MRASLWRMVASSVCVACSASTNQEMPSHVPTASEERARNYDVASTMDMVRKIAQELSWEIWAYDDAVDLAEWQSFEDSWGRAMIVMVAMSERKVTVTSRGPDGDLHTKDDIEAVSYWPQRHR